MTANPRKLAVEALVSAENGGYSNLVLDKTLKSNSLTIEDEALFSALFYGTIERLLTIHTILGRYCSHPVKKLKPEIRAILSSAIYQLLFMDKIPQSAAVNEAVKLARAGKYKQLSGFVNAVLRSITRDKDNLIKELQTTEDLSFKYSAASSFVEEIVNQYGREQAEEFLASAFSKPPVFARKNTLLQETVDEENYISTDVENCFIVKNPNRFLKSRDFENGRFHIEDKACQIACKVLDLQPGERVLDTCAAPGGKTFTLAQYMQNAGEIVACDLHEHRVKLIEQGARRLKIANIKAQVNNAGQFNSKFGEFDKILCDVPCSGYGVIRRKPEIKLKETNQFTELPNIQYEILKTSASYLKKGGFLLYSTCTVRKEENDSIVERFIKENKDYKIVTKRQLMPQTDGYFYRG